MLRLGWRLGKAYELKRIPGSWNTREPAHDSSSVTERTGSQITMNLIGNLVIRRQTEGSLVKDRNNRMVRVELVSDQSCWVHIADWEGGPKSWEAASICMN
jgi:hypothetical protein